MLRLDRAAGSVLLLMVVALSGCATAQSTVPIGWKNKAGTPGTLGGALEPEFASILRTCRFTLGSDSLSWLPPEIHEELPLDRGVRVENAESAGRLFGFIFEHGRLDEFDRNAEGLQSPVLELEVLPQSRPGQTRVLFYQDCASVLNTALELGFDPPVGTLEAAVQATFDGIASVGLVQGVFRSPLDAALSEYAPAQTRVRTLLDIWQWHADHRTRASDTLRYLAGFEGLALIGMREEGRKTEYDLSSEVTFSAGVASASGTLSLEQRLARRLTRRSFQTLIYLNGDSVGAESVRFAVLPSPSRIAEATGKVHPVWGGDPSRSLRQGLSSELHFSVHSLPRGLCERADWTLEDPRGIVLDSIQIVEAGAHEIACRFSFTHPPVSSDSTSPDGTKRIELFVVSDLELDDARLRIPFSVLMNTTTFPRAVAAGRASGGEVVGFDRMRWEQPIRLEDPEEVVNRSLSSNDLLRPRVLCGPVTYPASAQLYPSSPPDRYSLEVTLVLERSVIDSEQREECTFMGELEVNLSEPEGATVRRPLQTTIEVPRYEGPEFQEMLIPRPLGRAPNEFLAGLPLSDSLTIPVEVEGILEAGTSHVLLDGTLAEVYSVSLAAGDTVVMEMRSDELDAFLYLAGPGLSEPVVDDDSGGDSDARLEFAVGETGLYRVVASTYAAGQEGAFRFFIRE